MVLWIIKQYEITNSFPEFILKQQKNRFNLPKNYICNDNKCMAAR